MSDSSHGFDIGLELFWGQKGHVREQLGKPERAGNHGAGLV